jgi:hypothetical protein
MTMHSSNIASLQQAALDLMAKGCYKEAEPFLREAHHMALPKNDAGTHKLTKHLAQSLVWQGKLKEAEPFVHRGVQWFQNKYGPDDEDTLDCKSLEVEFCFHKKNYRIAEEVARHTIEGLVQNLKRGPEHSMTLRCTAFLALVLKAEHKFGEAEAFAKTNEDAVEECYKKADQLEKMGSRRMSHAERRALEQVTALNKMVLDETKNQPKKIQRIDTVSTQAPGSEQSSRATSKEVSGQDSRFPSEEAP